MIMYCFKCRAKQEVGNAERVVLKNGRKAVRAICRVCATRVFRFGEMAELTELLAGESG